MIFNETSVIEELEIRIKTTESWVVNSREYSKTLKAIINGEDFHEELIERIAYLESPERALAREKYARDIRDLFTRVTVKRQNVFSANGTSENISIKNDKIKDEFTERLASFKSNKSIHKYLSEVYFDLRDIDPNGILMLEYAKEDEVFDLYPTYKSINNIRFYIADGQKVKYIIFEPKQDSEKIIKVWRFVDDITDWTINEVAGKFYIDKDKTFEHPFGNVPVLILSEKEKTGTNERLSPIDPILELAKEYALDKSITSIYRIQKGFPIHYRFGSKCKPCAGTGLVEGQSCPICNGTGFPSRGDVTDMYVLPLPKEGQPPLPNKLMGFESPDIDFLEYMDNRLQQSEVRIDDTAWGGDKLHNSDKSNETATGRFIDHQPYISALNIYTDSVEYVDNTLANWVLNFVDLTKDREEKLYFKSYGRRYILENPDILTEKYQKAKEKGDNNTILDKLLEEVLLSKYKSDPFMQATMIKKSRLEPLVHVSMKETKEMFGSKKAAEKILFQEFWKDADSNKEEKVLKIEFEKYINLNIKNYESSEVPKTVV